MPVGAHSMQALAQFMWKPYALIHPQVPAIREFIKQLAGLASHYTKALIRNFGVM